LLTPGSIVCTNCSCERIVTMRVYMFKRIRHDVIRISYNYIQ